MKKLLSLLLVLILFVSSFAVFASANETENPPPEPPVSRYMCDVDGDGTVEAEDARAVLRFAVGLDELDSIAIVYADSDFNGKIQAPDARMALRTAVDLEEKVSFSFAVKEEKAATCSEKGYVKAECAVTEKSVEIETDVRSHKLDEAAYCAGEGVCKLCNDTITVAQKHDFADYVCRVCGLSKKKECYDSLVEHIKNHGQYDSGLYFCIGADEYANYALCYDADEEYVYIYCFFATDTDGTILYYDSFTDIAKNFEGYVTELDCYHEDQLVAYGIYDVDPAKLSDEAPGAITQTEYDSIDELKNLNSEFMVIAEAGLFESINWILSYGAEQGFGDILTADLMGFTAF